MLWSLKVCKALKNGPTYPASKRLYQTRVSSLRGLLEVGSYQLHKLPTGQPGADGIGLFKPVLEFNQLTTAQRTRQTKKSNTGDNKTSQYKTRQQRHNICWKQETPSGSKLLHVKRGLLGAAALYSQTKESGGNSKASFEVRLVSRNFLSLKSHERPFNSPSSSASPCCAKTDWISLKSDLRFHLTHFPQPNLKLEIVLKTKNRSSFERDAFAVISTEQGVVPEGIW